MLRVKPPARAPSSLASKKADTLSGAYERNPGAQSKGVQPGQELGSSFDYVLRLASLAQDSAQDVSFFLLDRRSQPYTLPSGSEIDSGLRCTDLHARSIV